MATPVRYRSSLLKEQLLVGTALAAVLTATFYLLAWYNARRASRGEWFGELDLPWDQVVPFWPSWVWVYMLYFPACFLPLAWRAVRRDPGTFRATATGFAMQFAVALVLFATLPVRMVRPAFDPTTTSEHALAWLYYFDPGFNVFPSLHVANLTYVACIAWRLGGSAPGLLAWFLSILVALSAVLVKQHYIVDLPAGALLGVAAYRLGFVRVSNALHAPGLLDTLRFHLGTSRKDPNWERSRELGGDARVRPLGVSSAQRPRHYAIHGLVRDHCAPDPMVLEVGCGEGLLYGMLRGHIGHYAGVDSSEGAIAAAHQRYGGDPCARFVARSFEEYKTTERFDVVILNESQLYYFQWRRIAHALGKARGLLRDGEGLIVVSMNRTLKARLVWYLLHRELPPALSMGVQNMMPGGSWTVHAYRQTSPASTEAA